MSGSELRFARASAFWAALVAFAALGGPPCFAQAPVPTNTAPSAIPSPARVRLVLEAPTPLSTGEHTLFGARPGERPRRLCSSCELRVEAGAYQFGLRVGRRRYREVGDPIHLDQDTRLEFSVQSRRGLRIGLGVVGAIAAVAGIALVLDGISCLHEYSGCEVRGDRESIVGLALAPAGGAMLLAVPFVIDRGRVHVTRLSSDSPARE